jgi:hypothetical protein
VPGNAYILETLEGEKEFDRAINGKFLKKYYHSIWLMLESRFVETSALIADTKGVSPLAQKINPKKGVKDDMICVAHRAKTNTKTIIVHMTKVSRRNSQKLKDSFVHSLVCS